MRRVRAVGLLIGGVAVLAAALGRCDAPPLPRRLCADAVQALAVSPDGRTLAIGAGRDVRLVTNDGRVLKTLSGHQQAVAHVAFSPDGQTVASAAEPGDPWPLRFWDAETGELIRRWGDACRCVRGLAFTPDGQQLAVMEPDAVTLHNPRLGRHAGELPLPRGWTNLSRLALSPDGKTLAVGCETARRAAFDVATRTIQHQGVAPGPCLGMQFLADGRRLLWIDTYDLHICDGDGGAPPFAAQNLCNATALAVSPDGGQLAVARGAALSLWDVAARRPLAALTGHRGTVRAVAFTAKGTLVSAGEDGAFAWQIP